MKNKRIINPQPAVPILGRDGKIILVSELRRHPAADSYEDLANTVTSSSRRRAAASTLAPRMPLHLPGRNYTEQDAAVAVLEGATGK